MKSQSPSSFEQKKKDVRGLETFWLEEKHKSKKFLFYFIHGFPDTAHSWEKQMEFFKNYGDVVSPFARGLLERKTFNDSRYTPDSIVLDHLNILNEIDPKRKKKLIIVGHDIGSVYAWKLSELLADRMGALVIINGASLLQMFYKLLDWRQMKKSWYIFMFQFPKVSEQVWKLMVPKVLGKLKKQGYPYRQIPEKKYKIASGLSLYREGFKEMLRGAWETRKKSIHKVEFPLLVLHSERDPFINTPSLSEIDRMAKDFTIRILEEGHWPQCQNPEKINKLILKFLQDKNIMVERKKQNAKIKKQNEKSL